MKAIAPFVKVVRELNLYHGVNVGSARLAPPAALPEIAPIAPPLALTHSPGVAVTEYSKTKKVAQKRSKLLKSLVRVNCARGPHHSLLQVPGSRRMHRWGLREQPGDIDRHAGDKRRGKQPVGQPLARYVGASLGSR